MEKDTIQLGLLLVGVCTVLIMFLGLIVDIINLKQ